MHGLVAPCWLMGEAMYCSSCGAAQSDRARFCSRCGAQLDDAGEQSPPAVPTFEPAPQQPSPAAQEPWAQPQQQQPAAPAYAPWEQPQQQQQPPAAAPAYEPWEPPQPRQQQEPQAAPAYEPWGQPQPQPQQPQQPPAAPAYEPWGQPQQQQPAAAPSYEPPSPPPAASPYWAANEQPRFDSPAYQPTVGYQPPAGQGYPQPPPAGPGYAPPAGPGYVPPQRRRRGATRVVATVAAVVVVLAVLAVAGWKEHFPSALFGGSAPKPLTWSAAKPPLPADASTSSGQTAFLNDIACSSVASCLSVGYYQSTGSDSDGLTETLSAGSWAPAVGAGVPGASGDTYVYLEGLSCPSQGSCVAAGSYFDSQNIQKPVIETLSGTTWTATRPPLPGDANKDKNALLAGVACPAAGICVAAGWYTDSSGDTRAMLDTLSGGTWTSAAAPLPAGAVPGPQTSSSVPTALFVVKCPAVGSCEAVGDYADGGGGYQGLIETLSGGTWTATTAPLPAGAAAAPVSYLWAVTCTAPGTCVAVGNYTSRSGQNTDLIETLSGGTWNPVAAGLPAGAAASQKFSPDAVTGLTAVACRTAGACVAAGSYTARGGAVVGVIDTQSGGTWTAARAPLPAGAATAKQYVFFDSAVCPASGYCIAVGGYNASNGSTQPLIETGAAASG
ncbi:zinc ribbon domain-containing protein [Trebonia sp.]|uniref:zinc ribbon domain-containing protein n=1 Tax=Trebonia sp. TaxID=2767075 RepID=UPI00261C3C44|nr:zinc ribbon domain-containing protein [Trebonia sp.]